MLHDAVHRRWSLIFGIASLLTPFFLGATLGATGSGAIRVEGGLVRTGFFAGWTGAFAMACGLFAQCLFAFLAATYLTVDTDDRPELQEDFRRRARAAGLALIPAAVPDLRVDGMGTGTISLPRRPRRHAPQRRDRTAHAAIGHHRVGGRNDRPRAVPRVFVSGFQD